MSLITSNERLGPLGQSTAPVPTRAVLPRTTISGFTEPGGVGLRKHVIDP